MSESDKIEFFELPQDLFQNEISNSKKINEAYLEEIRRYQDSPDPPCTEADAYRLLKKFHNKLYFDFRDEPVAKYLPAVSQGMMKLTGIYRNHDEAVDYARELAESFDEKELARAYLYGIAHNIPAYTTALACCHYIRNLPKHDFEKYYVGTTAKGNIYCDSLCEICQYHSEASREPKMEFWHINLDMAFFYLTGRVGSNFQLNTAITYLEEFKKLEKPPTSADDLEYFRQIIRYIESLPENTTPAKLRSLLKKSGLLKMTLDQLDAFIDMLGFLNILHSPDSFGVTVGHTCIHDMLPPLSMKTYSAYPVNRWTMKYGVDHAAIHALFDGLY